MNLDYELCKRIAVKIAPTRCPRPALGTTKPRPLSDVTHSASIATTGMHTAPHSSARDSARHGIPFLVCKAKPRLWKISRFTSAHQPRTSASKPAPCSLSPVNNPSPSCPASCSSSSQRTKSTISLATTVDNYLSPSPPDLVLMDQPFYAVVRLAALQDSNSRSALGSDGIPHVSLRKLPESRMVTG